MKKRTLTTIIFAGSAMMLASTLAVAQPGPGRGRGWGRGGGMGGGMGHMRCGRILFRAHPDVLKAQLGLNDKQLVQIRAVRTNFLTKRITARAEIQKLRLKKRELFLGSDLPNEQKLLNLMRKTRSQRGRIQEERTKTHLRIMRVLTKEQRTQLRTKCYEMGWGRGKGRRWGNKGWGRGGRGRGWGRGPRGPGPGPGF